MDHFYVTLPSGSSGFHFPNNTIANYRTILATRIEVEPKEWEVELVEISYPKGYKKCFRHNIIRLDLQVIFPVKDYESLISQIFLICRNRLKWERLCAYLMTK